DHGRACDRQRYSYGGERAAGPGPRRSEAEGQGRRSCQGGTCPDRHPGEIRVSANHFDTGIRLCVGTNTFGWLSSDDESFAVLDRFYEAGGRMLDTAQGYSIWIEGHVGGESEAVIGKWLHARGVRTDMRIATKTGIFGKPGDL